MGVATILNLNTNACKYDHSTKHAEIAPYGPIMCIYCFSTLSGQFFLLSVAVA